jgi:hypothetical protein
MCNLIEGHANNEGGINDLPDTCDLYRSVNVAMAASTSYLENKAVYPTDC